MQPQFRHSLVCGGASAARRDRPVRPLAGQLPRPPRARLAGSADRVGPVALRRRGFAPFRLAGAWRLTSRRSALRRHFGARRRPRPAARAERFGRRHPLLATGRGRRRCSANCRRSRQRRLQAQPRLGGAGRDPRGRGWWVAFENRHELWLYDRDLGRALQRISLGDRSGASKRGIEGAVADGESLLLLHEAGGRSGSGDGRAGAAVADRRRGGAISDAVALGGGRMADLERRLTPRGLSQCAGRRSSGRRALIGSAAVLRCRSGPGQYRGGGGRASARRTAAGCG